MHRRNTNIKDFFYTETIEKKGFVLNGILIAILLFSCFSILDYFMLPQTYTIAWIIRGSLVLGAAILLLFIKYWQKNILHYKYLITIITGIYQFGATLIIYYAKANEAASWEYYVGYILILVYVAFIFKLSTFVVLLNVLLSILLFNIVFHLKLSILDIPAYHPTYLLNGNFYLSSAGLLVLIGSIHLNKYSAILNKRNQELNREKSELILARKKANETEILKAKFLANFSHELRTPLNSILGFSEIINSDKLSNDELKLYSGIVFKKSSELQLLIDNLIDMSILDAKQLKINISQINLYHLFESLIEKTKGKEAYLQKKDEIKIIIDIDKKLKTELIDTDEFRLNQILDNLITNSIKFTPKGEVKILCNLKDDFIQFVIKDEGVGMNKETLNSITNVFNKTEYSVKTKLNEGLGLGLIISKNLIELMGGNLWVKSELDIGTEMKFILPAKYESD